MAIPVYSVSVPEYHVHTEPDHKAIGRKIDLFLKKNFSGKRVAIRCLGSQEHRGKSLHGLVKIIKKFGTDRYDKRRKGDRYDNLGKKHMDFFALEFKMGKNSRIMEKFIEPFYYWPKKSGEKPVRLDLVLLYDRTKVRRVSHTYDGKRIKRDGFVFRFPERKPDALVGIVKIL